ncbi:MAG: hypothetical protein IJ120_00850 [Solobacterium sp.]|nr:hypothetical protein [Solobacterium sp.]
MMGFVIWAAVCLLLFLLGIHAYRAEKPAGFWANVPSPGQDEVTDVKAYNHAVGKLLAVYAVVVLLCGIPLLSEAKATLIITMLGTVFATLAVMICYTLYIEPKYRK